MLWLLSYFPWTVRHVLQVCSHSVSKRERVMAAGTKQSMQLMLIYWVMMYVCSTPARLSQLMKPQMQPKASSLKRKCMWTSPGSDGLRCMLQALSSTTIPTSDANYTCTFCMGLLLLLMRRTDSFTSHFLTLTLASAYTVSFHPVSCTMVLSGLMYSSSSSSLHTISSSASSLSSSLKCTPSQGYFSMLLSPCSYSRGSAGGDYGTLLLWSGSSMDLMTQDRRSSTAWSTPCSCLQWRQSEQRRRSVGWACALYTATSFIFLRSLQRVRMSTPPVMQSSRMREEKWAMRWESVWVSQSYEVSSVARVLSTMRRMYLDVIVGRVSTRVMALVLLRRWWRVWLSRMPASSVNQGTLNSLVVRMVQSCVLCWGNLAATSWENAMSLSRYYGQRCFWVRQWAMWVKRRGMDRRVRADMTMCRSLTLSQREGESRQLMRSGSRSSPMQLECLLTDSSLSSMAFFTFISLVLMMSAQQRLRVCLMAVAEWLIEVSVMAHQSSTDSVAFIQNSLMSWLSLGLRDGVPLQLSLSTLRMATCSMSPISSDWVWVSMQARALAGALCSNSKNAFRLLDRSFSFLSIFSISSSISPMMSAPKCICTWYRHTTAFLLTKALLWERLEVMALESGQMMFLSIIRDTILNTLPLTYSL